MLKHYIALIKPGIIFGNAVTCIAGFALASRGNINPTLFLITLLGLSLIIASACVFNNYFDRDHDAKMERTKNRPLVLGVISTTRALVFAFILGITGAFLLGAFTNTLALTSALAGFVIYVFFYTRLKYLFKEGTLIGSIAGAMPPVVGYCAVSNRFDLGALLLFLIVCVWQMPHFFAIAMYRIEDYTAAEIPVLPVSEGAKRTKIHMLLYVIAFIATTFLLSAFGYTGSFYLISSLILGAIWLVIALKGFQAENDKKWARGMFLYSLIVIMTLSTTISFDAL